MILHDLITIEKYLTNVVTELRNNSFTDYMTIYSNKRNLLLYSVNKFNNADYFSIGDTKYYKRKGFGEPGCTIYYYYDCSKNKYLKAVDHTISISFIDEFVKSVIKTINNKKISKGYYFDIDDSVFKQILKTYREKITNMLNSEEDDLSYLFTIYDNYNNLFNNIKFYIQILDYEIFNQLYKNYKLGVSYNLKLVTYYPNIADISDKIKEYVNNIEKQAKEFFNKNLESSKFLSIDFVDYVIYLESDYKQQSFKYCKEYDLNFIFYMPNLDQLFRLYIIEQVYSNI